MVGIGSKGKYDDIAGTLCKDLQARAVVLIVVDGRKGTGFSVSIDPRKPGAVELGMGGAELVWILRNMADMIQAGRGPDGANAGPKIDDGIS